MKEKSINFLIFDKKNGHFQKNFWIFPPIQLHDQVRLVSCNCTGGKIPELFLKSILNISITKNSWKTLNLVRSARTCTRLSNFNLCNIILHENRDIAPTIKVYYDIHYTFFCTYYHKIYSDTVFAEGAGPRLIGFTAISCFH